MDWQTILASIVSSSVIASGIGYVLKKGFDQALAIHFERISSENKALIQESSRRYAFIYDKQYGVFKLILSLTYRSRNIVRELSGQVENMSQRENWELYKRFKGYHEALVELIYEERAILPAPIFQIAHDSKSMSSSILMNLEYLERKRNDGQLTSEKIQSRYKDIRAEYEMTDKLYNELVQRVQDAIGIHHEAQDA